MRKDVVLVAKDPIQWKTLIRLTDNEPQMCTVQQDDNDVAPYYTDEHYPVEGYDCDELDALRVIKPAPKKWYVRLQGIDGTVRFKELDGQALVRSALDSETNLLSILFRDFLISIGAAGWVEIKDDEEVKSTDKKKFNFSLGGGKRSDDNSGRNEASGGARFERIGKSNVTSLEHVRHTFPAFNPNFVVAERLLNKYDFLNKEFRIVYDAVKGGLKKGSKLASKPLAKECVIKYSEEIERICKCAIGVAAKYKKINAGLRVQFDKELKQAIDKKQSVCYQVSLPVAGD